MAKKKTRVTLPGSLSDLVRDLQNGGNGAQINKEEENNTNNIEEQQQHTDNEGTVAAEEFLPHSTPEAPQTPQEPRENRVNADNRTNGQENANLSEGQNGNNATNDSQNRPIGNAAEGSRAYSPGRPAKKDTMKEYHIIKDDTKDSWDLFLDMAKQYKDGGGKLATIYIDGTLKNILDRMKYVGPEKLPTSAILSSIVARFIYDHEDEIRKALFSGNLF